MNRLSRHFVTLLVAATALLMVQTSTAAADTTYEIDVYFEKVTLDVDGSRVVVDYEFEHDSWHRAQRLGVTPRFDLTIPRDHADDLVIGSGVKMEQKSGTIRLQTHHLRGRLPTVQFSPISNYHTTRVGDVKLEGDFAYNYEFALRDAPTTYEGSNEDRSRSTRSQDKSHHSRSENNWSRSQDNWSRSQDTYGDGRTDSRRDRQRSQRRSQPQPQSERDTQRRDRRSERRTRQRDRRSESRTDRRVSIVDACGEQTTFDSDRDFCMETAPKIKKGNAADTVTACGEATSHSSHFQSCLYTATEFKAPAAATVRACGDATDHGTHFVECLEAAADYKRDASRIVESCGNSTDFSGRVSDCVYDATR